LFFCTVFTSALPAIIDAGAVKHTTDDMIPNARQIPDSASSNYNHAVLLEVVVNAWYVSCNFLAVGQSDTSDFSQSGVGLFGRLSSYNQTHASFLTPLFCGEPLISETLFRPFDFALGRLTN